MCLVTLCTLPWIKMSRVLPFLGISSVSCVTAFHQHYIDISKDGVWTHIYSYYRGYI